MPSKRDARDAVAPPSLPEDLTRSASLDLSGGQEIVETLVSGMALTGRDAPGLSLLWSRLENVTLQRCDLRGLEAQDVVFEGCDLSGSDLSESRLRRVEFRSCRLSGTTLSRSTLTDVRWTDCKLDRVNLRMAEGDCVWVLDSNMHEADLYAATFRSSRFLRSDLSACEFSQVDLHGARLQGSRLDGAKGAAGLKGVEVDPDQAVVLAQLLLELHEVTVRDDPER